MKATIPGEGEPLATVGGRVMKVAGLIRATTDEDIWVVVDNEGTTRWVREKLYPPGEEPANGASGWEEVNELDDDEIAWPIFNDGLRHQDEDSVVEKISRRCHELLGNEYEYFTDRLGRTVEVSDLEIEVKVTWVVRAEG